MLVILQVRLQIKHFGQIRARIDRTSILRLHSVDHRTKLPVLEDHNVDTLLYERLDLLHHLVAVVPHAHVHSYPLSVMIQLFIQSYLQLQVAGAQKKVLTNHRARLTALFSRSVLDLPDTHADGASLVSHVGLRVSGVDLEEVADSARFSRLVLAGLQSNAGRSCLRELEGERNRVRAQFSQQTFLKPGQVVLELLGRWEQLFRD
ncbi:hypothetical protein WH47_00750 [Habropoda laboriosa]|uniref:Uncharacterized protein n=1 Tax=Habropoda laboriosa TaxID=597456 RepID=A0A0L7QYP6_9HYME|nr:hypothetical protein WH47_00750 [Habropoda laboriosa]